jgi:4'-phosphopantetheinyl transferase
VLEREVHVWRAEVGRAASRQTLRQVLGRYLGADPDSIELRLGQHGKPALADPGTGLRFNLSHSGGIALIAVARAREVGIDVERIVPRRNLLGLAERALGAGAAAALRAVPADERPLAFHRAWVRHEALAKCHGVGLHRPLPQAPVSVVELDPGRGFAAALAVSGSAAPTLRERTLTAASPASA